MADSESPARSQYFNIPDVVKAIHSLPGRANATENEDILRRQVNILVIQRPNVCQGFPPEKANVWRMTYSNLPSCRAKSLLWHYIPCGRSNCSKHFFGATENVHWASTACIWLLAQCVSCLYLYNLQISLPSPDRLLVMRRSWTVTNTSICWTWYTAKSILQRMDATSCFSLDPFRHLLTWLKGRFFSLQQSATLQISF